MPDARISSSRPRRRSVSTVAGSSPSSPSTTAFGEPCPWPVAPSEPNSSARIRRTSPSRPDAASPSAKRFAARIGPTVCERRRTDADRVEVERRQRHRTSAAFLLRSCCVIRTYSAYLATILLFASAVKGVRCPRGRAGVQRDRRESSSSTTTTPTPGTSSTSSPSVTGALPEVVQHDATTAAHVLSFDHVVLSPGPGHPADPADFSVGREVLLAGTVPVLGVCLGMQGLVDGVRRAGRAGRAGARRGRRGAATTARASSPACPRRTPRSATTPWPRPACPTTWSSPRRAPTTRTARW